MTIVSGRDNKMLKCVRSLQKKKNRKESGLFFAEGVRMVKEALADAQTELRAILVSESYQKKEEAWIQELDLRYRSVYLVKDALFDGICNTENPQGIGVLLSIPKEKPFNPSEERFILALDGVSEPGNLGTMIRTAEAAGVDSVWLLRGCADLYNPKVVRATMGSLFRVPCRTQVEPTMLVRYQQEGFRVLATALRHAVRIDEAVKSPKQILVIGSEADGVSEEVLDCADQCVQIPMRGKVESLNAAVAAGIAMYLLKPNGITKGDGEIGR